MHLLGRLASVRSNDEAWVEAVNDWFSVGYVRGESKSNGQERVVDSRRRRGALGHSLLDGGEVAVKGNDAKARNVKRAGGRGDERVPLVEIFVIARESVNDEQGIEAALTRCAHAVLNEVDCPFRGNNLAVFHQKGNLSGPGRVQGKLLAKELPRRNVNGTKILDKELAFGRLAGTGATEQVEDATLGLAHETQTDRGTVCQLG